MKLVGISKTGLYKYQVRFENSSCKWLTQKQATKFLEKTNIKGSNKKSNQNFQKFSITLNNSSTKNKFYYLLKTFSVKKEIAPSPGRKRKSSKNNIYIGKRKKTFKENGTSNEEVQLLGNDKSNNSTMEKAKTQKVRAKPSSTAKAVREMTKCRVRGREKTRRSRTQPASTLKLPEKDHKDRASTSGYSSLGFSSNAYICILLFFQLIKILMDTCNLV